jgi:hypothetical protein
MNGYEKIELFIKIYQPLVFFGVNDDGDTDYMEMLYNRILV